MSVVAARVPAWTIVAAIMAIAPGWAVAQAPVQQCVILDSKCDFVLPGGCSCQKTTDDTTPPPLPAPPGCDPEEIKKQLSTLSGTVKFLAAPPNCSMTQDQCEALPGRHVDRLSDGTPVCSPNKCSKSCYKFGGSVEICSTCLSFPIDPKRSVDPNDKNGPLGALAEQFVAPDVPLSYTIHFENLSTATAAAQVVLVSDQLDPQLMDLATFRLGPISFGRNTLLPAPGVRGWTGGLDFRPAQNLIVSVAAGLDETTGLVTWRFTSIDPDTGKLTEDPDAGFLPPNTTPPAGEGSVVFTVMPKSGLATGTPIANHAVVVFDTNAPIPTPTWLNTIDQDAPVTHVLALGAAQSSPTFPVQWAGTDAGSGISGYTVFVSDNGGPFTKWLDGTTTSSASYVGQEGHTYAFFSAGVDRVGNVEPLKTAAEATTVVGTAPVCATDVSASIQVTRSGFRYNFATGRFVQAVTLKNMSGSVVDGPLSIVLDRLSSNATPFNASGTTACALPAGSPFINLSGNLGPGASGSITLEFTNPTRAGITYATRVLSGSAAR